MIFLSIYYFFSHVCSSPLYYSFLIKGFLKPDVINGFSQSVASRNQEPMNKEQILNRLCFPC